MTPPRMMIAATATVWILVSGVATSTDAQPVAVLRVGDSALWEGDARPAVASGGGWRRDYAISVIEPGHVLRVALDRRNFGVSLELYDPAGKRQVSGGGWYGFELFADAPPVGLWTARAVAGNRDNTDFRLRAKLEEAPAPKPSPPVTLLPNVRLVPPFEFTFEPPLGGFPMSSGLPNCSAQEVGETGARRCLRFSLGPANGGPGPLLVRFAPLEGLVTKGTAYQRVFDSDGNYTERPAGEYEYHKTHLHYHHSGFGTLELFRVADPATGALTKVGTGPKQGFCTGDVMIWDWEGFTQSRERTDSECVDEAASTGTNRPVGTTMGLTPGWADLYSWSQDGMYVEWSAGGDGLYVVRVTADSAGWILESDEQDNVSYAYVRVAGSTIQVLERGYGLDPWDPARAVANDRLPPTA